jgi:hypothetical protein
MAYNGTFLEGNVSIGNIGNYPLIQTVATNNVGVATSDAFEVDVLQAYSWSVGPIPFGPYSGEFGYLSGAAGGMNPTAIGDQIMNHLLSIDADNLALDCSGLQITGITQIHVTLTSLGISATMVWNAISFQYEAEVIGVRDDLEAASGGDQLVITLELIA